MLHAEENKNDTLKVLAAKAAAHNASKLKKKVLSVKNLWTLLLYYGVEKKEILASMKVAKIKDHYNKLKDAG